MLEGLGIGGDVLGQNGVILLCVADKLADQERHADAGAHAAAKREHRRPFAAELRRQGGEGGGGDGHRKHAEPRSEEHTSELQSLMRISYAVFCLKKKKRNKTNYNHTK